MVIGPYLRKCSNSFPIVRKSKPDNNKSVEGLAR